MGQCICKSNGARPPRRKTLSFMPSEVNALRKTQIIPKSQFLSPEELQINAINLGEDTKDLDKIKNPQRILFEGQMSSRTQKEYEDKRTNIIGNSSIETLNNLGIAISCKKGLKPDSPNQDDFSVIIDRDFIYFGVFDGHGRDGHEVSNFVRKELPRLIFAHPSFETKMQKALKESYLNTNKKLLAIGTGVNPAFETVLSGTTATSIIIKKNSIIIGHVGDSRAVLGIRSGDVILAERITTDHKPELPDERSRIESQKGQVRRVNNDIP